MPVTLKTNSFKYRDDSSEEWSPALVQATASLEPAFQDIGKLASELGIVVNGNTAAVNIAAGQYIILKNSTISGKEDGLYVAANAVSAGTALQSTDIPAAAITNGGLNALNDNSMKLHLYKNPPVDTNNHIYATTLDAYNHVAIAGFTPADSNIFVRISNLENDGIYTYQLIDIIAGSVISSNYDYLVGIVWCNRPALAN